MSSLAVQWVGPHDLTAKDAGSIPGWEISANLSAWQKKKKSTNFDESTLYCCSAFSFPLYKHQHFQRHQIWFQYLYPKTHPYALVRHGSFHLNPIFSPSPQSLKTKGSNGDTVNQRSELCHILYIVEWVRVHFILNSYYFIL